MWYFWSRNKRYLFIMLSLVQPVIFLNLKLTTHMLESKTFEIELKHACCTWHYQITCGICLYHENFCEKQQCSVFVRCSKLVSDWTCEEDVCWFLFWLCWVFVATCGLSLVAASGGYSLVEVSRASHCDGFSCCRAQAPGCLGFNSCGMWVQNL